MDACHVLLGKQWQYDVNTTHLGRKNIYIFWRNGKKILILPINKKGDETNTSKVEGKSHLSISNFVQEFIVNFKETRVWYALIVKEEKPPKAKISNELRSILKEFKEITPKKLPYGLLPMRDIQHQINLAQGASLLNLPHY